MTDNPIFEAEKQHLNKTQQSVINGLFSLMVEGDFNKITHHISQHHELLKALYTEIKHNKEIQTLPRATSLSYLAPFTEKEELSTLINILTAICYISTQDHLVNHFQHVIERAFHSARILGTKHSYFPLLANIQCNGLSLKAKVNYFTRLNEKCKKDKMPGKHLIYDIHHLLSLYQSDKQPPAKRKQTTLKPDSTIQRIVTKKSAIAFDEDEYKSHSFQSETIINNNIVNQKEYASDSMTATVYHEVDLSKTEYVSSLHLQQKQARKVAQHMYKREKQLPCDYRLLTKHELHMFVEYYLENPEDEQIALMFIVLCTGRSVEDLQYCTKDSADFIDELNGQAIYYKVNLPNHDVSDGLKQLLVNSINTLFLHVPLECYYISDVVAILYQKNNLRQRCKEIEKKCNERLKLLNKSFKSRLTIHRLQNAFSAFMHQHQTDSAEMAYLLGREIRQTASCFYHQTSVGQLVDIHQKWLDFLFSKQQQNITPLNLPVEKRFGSHLVMFKKAIKKLFSILKTELSEPVLKTTSVSNMHNRYVCYILLMLNLATGHRAVRHPYCFKDDFDLITNRLFISDKEGRGTLSARILPLPQVISSYLTEYNEHLSQLLMLESPYSSKTAKSILGAMNSSEPYFFFLDGHALQLVTPLNFNEQLKDTLPLPLNWNRHFIRGYLSHYGIHTHVIDAFMGHSSNAGEPFAKYSALGTHDLKPIAKELNILLVEHLGFSHNGLWGDHHAND
jgi:hypothetical protein